MLVAPCTTQISGNTFGVRSCLLSLGLARADQRARSDPDGPREPATTEPATTHEYTRLTVEQTREAEHLGKDVF